VIGKWRINAQDSEDILRILLKMKLDAYCSALPLDSLTIIFAEKCSENTAIRIASSITDRAESHLAILECLGGSLRFHLVSFQNCMLDRVEWLLLQGLIGISSANPVSYKGRTKNRRDSGRMLQFFFPFFEKSITP